MKNLKGRIPLQYLLYGLIAFCLLVAILFPYKRVAETVIHTIEKKSGVTLVYEKMDYRFPASCTFEHIEIYLPSEMGRTRVYAGDSLSLRVSVLSLLKKKIKLRFQGDGFGGQADGEVILPIPVRPELGSYHLNVNDIRYEEVVEPFYLRNFKITGRLTGQAEARFQGEDPIANGTGAIHASLAQGNVRNIFVQGMELPNFDFQTIEADGKLSNGKIHLERCNIDSEVLLAEIIGEIELNTKDILESKLQLKARLKPMEEDPINLHGVAMFFNKELDSEGYYPFQLIGTFRYPILE